MKKILLQRGGIVVSDDPDCVITLKSLGSTLAVIASDPNEKVSGIVHCILPKPVKKDSKILDALEQLRLLFKDMIQNGAKAQNLRIMLCGAATFLDAPSELSLGVMLYKRVKTALKKNGIKITGEHVGGPINRSVSITVGAEKAKVFLPENKEILI